MFPVVGSFRVHPLAVLAVALIASACSGQGSEGAGEAGSEPSVSTSIPGTTAQSISTDDEDEDEESIEDVEPLWAAQRGRVVDALSAPNYGVGEDNILRGPERLEVDLDDCPADWVDDAGVEATTVNVGMVVAQSGDQASFQLLAAGVRAYFDWINENGGIDGRQVTLTLRDDTYDAGVAQAAVEDLLAVEDPFMVLTVGSPGALATYGELNDACVPNPYVVTAHPAVGDPEEHPFSTGLELSYSTEALVWGAWIRRNLTAEVPVRVVGLVTDNDFGRIYADTFADWAEDNPDVVSEFTAVAHEPGALDVTAEMEEVAALQPEVFLSMTTGRPCLSAVSEAGRLGLSDTAIALFTPSVCKQPSSFMAPAGQAGDGYHVVSGGLRSLSDPVVVDDTFVRFARERLTEAGLDPDEPLVGVGFAHYGWAYVETMRIAAALPGGLTRSNLLLTMRNIDLQHPMLFDGARFSTAGTDDGFVLEGAEVSTYDAATQTWISEVDVIDIDGLTPNCVWDDLACGP